MSAHRHTRKTMIFSAWLALVLLGVHAALGRQGAVLSLPAGDGVLDPFDTDTWLRLTQARQFMGGGDFFDHGVRNTNAPFGGIDIHWTRPVDFLLAAAARLAPQSLSVEQRLMLAATWLPVGVGLAAFAFLARAAGTLLRGGGAAWCLALLAMTNLSVYNYFAPGYADHHNVLCALWCAVLALMLGPPSRRAGMSAGAALGVMIWISVETLLLLGPVYAILGMRGIKGPRDMRFFSWTAGAAAIVSAAGLLVEKPLGLILADITYDSLSIAHVTLLFLCAAGVMALGAFFTRTESPKKKCLAAFAAGLGIAGAMHGIFPKFFRGPLVDDDPFIFSDFLPFVPEAASVFRMPHGSAVILAQTLWQPALALLLVFACRERLLKKRGGLALCALLLWTLALVAVQVRWSYYLQPVAMVLIAALLPVWAARAKGLGFMPRPWRPAAVLAAAALAVNLTAGYMSPLNDSQYCHVMQYKALQSGTLQRLLGNDPLIVMADKDFAGEALFFSPYRVIAGKYNREAQGMKDLKALTEAPSAAAALPLLKKRQVDVLFFCPSLHAEDSWLRQLPNATRRAPWLEQVHGLPPTGRDGLDLLLFRVNLPPERGAG